MTRSDKFSQFLHSGPSGPVTIPSQTWRVGASCCHGGSLNRFFCRWINIKFSNSIACANFEHTSCHTMYIHDHEKKDNHDNSLVFLTTKAREFVGARFMPKYMNMLIPSISDHHDSSCHAHGHGPVSRWQCTCMQSITTFLSWITNSSDTNMNKTCHSPRLGQAQRVWPEAEN